VFNYAPIKTIADGLLKDFGRQYAVGGNGVRVKMSQSLIQQGLVQNGDRMYVFSNIVEPGDLIDIDNEPWFVVGVVEVNPANTPIVYRAHVRK
jgi:hypothetical protein